MNAVYKMSKFEQLMVNLPSNHIWNFEKANNVEKKFNKNMLSYKNMLLFWLNMDGYSLKEDF